MRTNSNFMKTLIVTAAFGWLLSSCKQANLAPGTASIVKVDTPTFANVLIIGNSITYTPPNTGDGWFCSCGMAATVPDNDYVHLLTARFKKLNPNCVVTIGSSYLWELGDDNSFDLKGTYSQLVALKPDLVVFRLGEDVNQSPLDTSDFGNHYRALINYFTHGEIILGVGSIWSRPVTDRVMKSNTPNFITLANLNNLNLPIYSYGLFTDPGIQQHPSDVGHRLIADSIWKEVQLLRIKLIKK